MKGLGEIAIFVLIILSIGKSFSQGFAMPVKYIDRKSSLSLQFTKIGHFGEIRKARPGIPEHLHTGVDIIRPFKNYIDEPVFSVSDGIVISIRDDGPFAQIIIEHNLENSSQVWSVYEHISGINVELYQMVTSETIIARFMNKDELSKYGWQFDHLHLEIMKVKPVSRKPLQNNLQLHYSTYWSACSNNKDLNFYYVDPIDFILTHN